MHEALQECCNRTEKEVDGVKIKTNTTIAEAEFMNNTLTYQVFSRQVKAQIKKDENLIK